MSFGNRRSCPPDRKCHDGFIESGWRLVRADGEVKFGKGVWRADGLRRYIGFYVMIRHTHGFGLTAECWPNGLSMPIKFDERIELEAVS